MKKINLKIVCDSALKDELEKRGYRVQYISKNINGWKFPNKIIEFETEYGYLFLGETKEFTAEEFEKTIREFLDIPQDDGFDFCRGYFKLNSIAPNAIELVECKESDEEAIEFWKA